MSLAKAPRINKAGDLATLCANCHAVIHSDPKKALSLAAIRPYMLRRRSRQ
jgi:hypothetical protein